MSQLTLSAVLKIVDEATRPLKEIRRQTELNSDGFDDLTNAINRLNHTLNNGQNSRYNRTLKENHNNVQLVRTATRLLIQEYDRVSHVLTTIINKTGQWSQALKNQRAQMRQDFKATAIMGVTGGLTAYNLLKPAIDFEKQASRVQAVLDLDKKSAEMQKLIADARKQGAASSFSPTEAAQAQHALASGGFGTQQILDSLAGTLQLAEAGQVELAQAAQIAVGTLNGFGLQAKEITRVNDIMLRATDLTATSVDGFGETMKYVAPIAKAYGSSIEETSAMIGLLGNNNILDSQAGTSLRAIMTRFATLPKPAITALNRLKIKTADANGQLRSMTDIITDVARATKNMGSQDRLDIFASIAGQEAVSAFSVLIEQTDVIDENTGKSVNNLKKVTEQLENSQGAAAKAAAILKDNLAGDIEQLGGSVQDLSIALSNALGSDLRTFIKGIGETVDRIKVWVEANPELVRTIFRIIKALILFKLAMFSIKYTGLLVFGTIFSLIAGITKLALVIWLVQKALTRFGVGIPSRFKVYSTVIGWVSRAFFFLAKRAIPLVITGLRMLAVAMLTNPLTWIIGLIVAVALLIYRYWQPIKAFFKGFWDGLKIGLAPAIDTIRNAFNNLKTTLAPLQPVWDLLVTAWQTFKGVLGEMLTPMQATNQELQNATNYGQTLGQAIGIAIGLLIESFITLGTWIGEAFGWLTINIPKAIERAENALTSLKESIKSIGLAFLDFLLAPLRLVINSINILIDGLNRIPKVNIPKIPQIPSMSLPATGGASAPTVQIPLRAQTVPPLKTPTRANSASVTNHFTGANINITGVNDPKQVANIVDQQLRQHEQKLAAQQRRSYGDLA